MKKLLVFAVVLVSVAAFAAVNLDVFGAYHFTLSASPTDAASLTYLTFGGAAMFEVAEGVEIGGGVGLAYFLKGVEDFLPEASQTKMTLDLLVVAKYFLPIDDFSGLTFKGYGGLSVPNFTKFDALGYVVGIGLYYTFDLVDFKFGVGAGIEMRTYKDKRSATTIPVGALLNVRF
ncbi:hypothetical protein [Pseudothermotoga thermarum]|uniref:Outer membrane protein beta-barrel domain-containing protein n=1 Tax=Pseudothermotoga thermarum DSM 5069 TaxID=688269 RepID=F7YXB4_9THEM|nr:hypothetical protein [Pseudothermotoga thermarum]AEH51495.1 hypothetical protein Theth_1438 [Pseudothermotoga thermarum DSM 5069]